MKLYLPVIGEPVEIGEEKVPALVIENPSAFRDILSDLAAREEGSAGEAVLSEKDAPVPVEKYCEVLQQFFPFSLNKKTLLAKIAAMIEKEGLDEAHFETTQRLLAEWELYLDRLSERLPCRIRVEKLSFGSLVKAAGVAIEEDSASLPEALLAYMELVYTLEREKLFILVNLRGFMAEEELEAFLETALAHKYKLLLLDSHAESRLKAEERLTLDKDLCVF